MIRRREKFRPTEMSFDSAGRSLLRRADKDWVEYQTTCSGKTVTYCVPPSSGGMGGTSTGKNCKSGSNGAYIECTGKPFGITAQNFCDTYQAECIGG